MLTVLSHEDFLVNLIITSFSRLRELHSFLEIDGLLFWANLPWNLDPAMRDLVDQTASLRASKKPLVETSFSPQGRDIHLYAQLISLANN